MWEWLKKFLDRKRIAEEEEHYARPRKPVVTDEELAALAAQLGLDPATVEKVEGADKAP